MFCLHTVIVLFLVNLCKLIIKLKTYLIFYVRTNCPLLLRSTRPIDDVRAGRVKTSIGSRAATLKRNHIILLDYCRSNRLPCVRIETTHTAVFIYFCPYTNTRWLSSCEICHCYSLCAISAIKGLYCPSDICLTHLAHVCAGFIIRLYVGKRNRKCHF